MLSKYQRNKVSLEEDKQKPQANYTKYDADKDEILTAFHSNFEKPIIKVLDDYLQHGTPEDEKICWLRIAQRTNAEHEVLKPWLLVRFSDVEDSMLENGLPFLPHEQSIAVVKQNQKILSAESLDDAHVQQGNEFLLSREDKSEFSYEIRNWLLLAKLYSLSESGDSILFKKDLRKASKCFERIFKLCPLYSLPLRIIIDYLFKISYHIDDNRGTIIQYIEQLAKDKTRADFWQARYFLSSFEGDEAIEPALREGVAQNETQAYLSLGNFLKNNNFKDEAYTCFAKAAKQGSSHGLIRLIELLLYDQIFKHQSITSETPCVNIAKAYAKAASERRNESGLYYYAQILAAENSAASASQALVCYAERARVASYYDERELILIANANKSNLSSSFWHKHLSSKKSKEMRQHLGSGYQWAGLLSDEQRAQAAYLAVKGADYWLAKNPIFMNKISAEVGDPREHFRNLAKSQMDAVQTVTAHVSQENIIACFPPEHKDDADAFIAAIVNKLMQTYPLIHAHLRVNVIAELTLEYLADSKYVEKVVNKYLVSKTQHSRWKLWKRKESQTHTETPSSILNNNRSPS
ncbi:MAG: hypothetical protein ABI597_11505 [Gammaproteobacteria bacterium]